MAPPQKISSLKEALDYGRSLLRPSVNAALDARLLLQYATGLSHEQLILLERESVKPAALDHYHCLLQRRVDGAPIDALTGVREFWSLDFLTTTHVLTPRPESELIVSLGLAHFPDCDHPLRILDIGTGSACLAIALLHERPQATAIAIDLSQEALAVAKQNAHRHGVADRLAFCCHDFAEPVDGTFDLIVSNPPYVADGADLPREVLAYDPTLALFGGADGLRAYDQIGHWVLQKMAPEGLLLLEIGAGQGDDVCAILNENATRQGMIIDIKRHKDLAGIERVVALKTPKTGDLSEKTG